jgi:hypothetical protein
MTLAQEAGIGKTEEAFERDGFAVITDLLDDDDCERLASNVAQIQHSGAGSRTLLDHFWCKSLACRLKNMPQLTRLLPVGAVGVQCTLFDKSPAKNWLVSLHQDLSVPVRHPVESPECSGWSEKEGCLYVQPPVWVVERLVAVRVHIDDCTADNGGLRVVPGSHAFGRLDSERMEALRMEHGEIWVPVSRGGALAMRPMILHASSKAITPMPRRVLHFVYGPPSLPLGLEWRDAV